MQLWKKSIFKESIKWRCFFSQLSSPPQCSLSFWKEYIISPRLGSASGRAQPDSISKALNSSNPSAKAQGLLAVHNAYYILLFKRRGKSPSWKLAWPTQHKKPSLQTVMLYLTAFLKAKQLQQQLKIQIPFPLIPFMSWEHRIDCSVQ